MVSIAGRFFKKINMKTKEEILHQFYENSGYEGGYAEYDVIKAMDEYAKQEAIEFWKWCIKKDYKLTLAANNIYHLYIQEKTKP